MQELKTRQRKKKVIVILTRKERQDKIITLFKNNKHRKFSQKEIFTALYGEPSEYSELRLFYLWTRILQDLNWLRKTTYCFVASQRNILGTYQYFLVTNQEQANCYISRMKKIQKNCGLMAVKCQKVVDKGLWKKL